MIISQLSLNIDEISLIMKSTHVAIGWNYPPVVLMYPKTIPIDVEYEMQHSHISLLVIRARHCRFPANKHMYETYPSRNIANKIPK